MDDKTETAGESIGGDYQAFGKTANLEEPFLYEGKMPRCGQMTHDAALYQPFYFHPDHLGSSTYISNIDGEISQHMEYFPFGETLVEEHKNSNNSPYKFNGKELDDETGNYYYGARYYNPKWSFWLSVDPLAEKYPGWSPYNYTLLNPVKLVDPDGRSVDDVIIKGSESQKAFDQLQASVNDELTLSMDGNGKITYTSNRESKLSKNAKQLTSAIDDNSIDVNVNAENTITTKSGDLYIGGAFSGNTVDGNTVSTKQEVNPNVLKKASDAHGKPGADLLHEVTESYQGGLISQKKGVSSPAAGQKGSIYKKAHRRATNQSGGVYERIYDASGKEMEMLPGNVYPEGIKSADWYVNDKKNNKVIIQKLD